MKRESRNYAATLGLQEKCHHTFVALSNPEREGDHDQSRVTAGLPSLSRCLHPQQCPRLPPLHLHLLEAPHAVQDVKLLPALREVDFAVNVIWVSQMNKGQVLQNQASEREKGAAGQGLGKQVEVFVTPAQQERWPKAVPHLTTSSCCSRQHCNSKLEGKVFPAADVKVFRC